MITSLIDGNEFNSNKFKHVFKNTQKIRKLFFGREKCDSKSLFEEFLCRLESSTKIEESKDIFFYIWNEFKLNEIPEVLAMVSIVSFTHLCFYKIQKFMNNRKIIKENE